MPTVIPEQRIDLGAPTHVQTALWESPWQTSRPVFVIDRAWFVEDALESHYPHPHGADVRFEAYLGDYSGPTEYEFIDWDLYAGEWAPVVREPRVGVTSRVAALSYGDDRLPNASGTPINGLTENIVLLQSSANTSPPSIPGVAWWYTASFPGGPPPAGNSAWPTGTIHPQSSLYRGAVMLGGGAAVMPFREVGSYESTDHLGIALLRSESIAGTGPRVVDLQTGEERPAHRPKWLRLATVFLGEFSYAGLGYPTILQACAWGFGVHAQLVVEGHETPDEPDVPPGVVRSGAPQHGFLLGD